MPNWTKEQELAIYKDNSNIIVSAGAGSGKTAVLTARVIRKLKDGVDINKLLVLTFTNEAAGEMKARIRNAISKEPSLKEQLDYIDGAYITTFDSFALSILRKYHYVIGASRNISIIDSSVINIKKEEAIDKIFNELYSVKDSDFLKLIGDFCVKDDSEIKKSILKISNSLDMKLDKSEFLDTYFDKFYDNDYISNLARDYLSKIISIKEEINNLYEKVLSVEESKVCEEYTSSLSSLINSDSYDEIKSNLNISLPRKVELKKEKDDIKSLIDSLKELTIYETKDEIVSSYLSTRPYALAIINIIKKLDFEINSYKEKNNSYEFVDVSKMAINIVKNNPSIRDEIKYFYNEIMVDEYQDTNDLQEIFISCIANNNVYMVGDIKQSIYRFRNANPLIFKDKYDNYSTGNNGFKIDLTKNFRSREEVLSDINTIFDKIMDNALGGANYSESHRMVFGLKDYEKENDKDVSNYLSFYNYSLEDKTYSNDEVEAFIIAKDIKSKINSGYKVFDKETKALRNATYDDFCIIMDRGTSFDLYKKIFEFENIPLVMYKDEVLTTSDDILILKNVVGFIIKIKKKEFDTEFKYLFTSIARSYLFEYSDDYIFSCFKNRDFMDNDIFSISKEIVKVLDEISTSDFISLIVDKFSFYKKIVKTNGINGIIVRTLYLKNIVKNLESLGYTPYDLKDYFDKMIDEELDIKYKLNNDVSGSVKIMNIHKSKGLEFPVCYYSGLYKKFNIRDFNDRFMFDNKYGIITPYYKEGIGSVISKTLAKDEYIKEEISEKIRLLYVALTRAREKMIFVCPLDDDIYNDDKLVNINDRLKYRSFLDIVNTIKNEFEGKVKSISDLSFVTKDYQKVKDIKLNNYDSSPLPIKEVSIEYNSLTENKFSKNSNKLLTKEELYIVNKGLDVHYAFEVTDFKNPNFNIKYGEYVKRFLDNDLFKNVKDAKVFKEYEFMYEENNSKYHGIIDLMLMYKDHVDIIDYKLSNIDDSNYMKQLNGYKNYISEKTGLSINTYLYSIEKDEFKIV